MTQTINATAHLTPDTLCAFIGGALATGIQNDVSEHLASCHLCPISIVKSRISIARSTNGHLLQQQFGEPQ